VTVSLLLRSSVRRSVGVSVHKTARFATADWTISAALA
jgi:hypothetical protein